MLKIGRVVEEFFDGPLTPIKHNQVVNRLPDQEDLQHLQADFSEILALDVQLSTMSHWRIGGDAVAILRPRSVLELQQVRAWINKRGLAHVVIGATSNLLFADEGLKAIAIQLGQHFTSLSVTGSEITAGAAAWVPSVARFAMQAGLSGVEHTCGIPGTIGGLIFMNGGSQRKSIGTHVKEVVSVTAAGELVVRPNEKCNFSYRSSVFQVTDDAIVEVRFGGLEPRSQNDIRREMLKILHDRGRKFPRKQPNCGSVFLSHPGLYEEHGPPGAVLDRLGFKGKRIGKAQFSEIHANFINNLGGARAAEVLELIREARAAILKHTGYLLEVEARYVSPSGVITSAS